MSIWQFFADRLFEFFAVLLLDAEARHLLCHAHIDIHQVFRDTPGDVWATWQTIERRIDGANAVLPFKVCDEVQLLFNFCFTVLMRWRVLQVRMLVSIPVHFGGCGAC